MQQVKHVVRHGKTLTPVAAGAAQVFAATGLITVHRPGLPLLSTWHSAQLIAVPTASSASLPALGDRLQGSHRLASACAAAPSVAAAADFMVRAKPSECCPCLKNGSTVASTDFQSLSALVAVPQGGVNFTTASRVSSLIQVNHVPHQLLEWLAATANQVLELLAVLTCCVAVCDFIGGRRVRL